MRQICLVIFLLLIFSTIAAAEDTQLFPLGNKYLKEKGIELPLPFGISVLVNHVMDDTKITEFKLVDPSWEIDGVSFKESESETTAWLARFDLWVLPMLNIYAVGGFLDGESKTTIQMDFIGSFADFEFDIEEDYHGSTLGIGATLVYGGKNNWFASLDVNYTEADLDVVEGSIKTLMITPRVGYDMKQYGLPFFLGIGIPYLDIEQTLTAKVPAPRLGQDIIARVHVKNEKNWNAVLTGGFEINRHWQVIAEMGFYDRKSLLAQLSYRF